MIARLLMLTVSSTFLLLTPLATLDAADAPTVPRSSLERGLAWVGVAVEEPDYTIWGGAPIIGDDGKVHLFCARWPESNVNPAWRKSSEIAHYVADRPEGPFRFHDVAATGTGRNTWDRYTAHNPEIYKFKDTYVLLYTANTDFHQPPHPFNQSIGMKASKSLNGPWKSLPYTGRPLAKAPQGRSVINWKTTGTDGLLITASPDANHWTHGMMVVNPGILAVAGKFHLYFKSRYKSGPAIGLAMAEHLEGPYVMRDQPLGWVENHVIESPVPFHWGDKVCLLTSDNHGKLTGIRGALALWVSNDGGFTFPRQSVQLACDLIPRYFHDYQPATVKKIYGRDPKIEEARILHLNGQPAYLYGSSGFAVHGGQRTACYVFRINLKPGEGPVPARASNPKP